ncbi:MAG TPA: hypothetical protein DIC30_07970 [Oceanospirillales bacterium]|jgi:hypothetical protein|nr:hypothetical protein [Oceanospirillales bacterium]|tara:strand:- start:1437 stop:1736 length:300 start_codon:yes stop_codon:yes gene_type:complete
MKNSRATLKFSLNIRKAIASASNESEILKDINYTVDWSNFPNSLKMQCLIYQKQPENIELTEENKAKSIKIIQLSFLKQGIKFRDIRKNIEFDLTTDNP